MTRVSAKGSLLRVMSSAARKDSVAGQSVPIVAGKSRCTYWSAPVG